MGSRRIIARSSFSNGRSSSRDEVSGSSRRGGCSYLSNVRPGNRSTLCSVMAQLTEETQPSFQTTLKSKAVSERCNVKLSCVVTGFPTPQVIWYKDDVQLDRYCGLPKYEIFRNGQSHSLHIYNCTVEDAAIYQASASNSKGIVSCSGVLEVGEMNEFKIHQRYFAKIKQKAENRRREAEGKENQEPLRTISPERSQRKRPFLSPPSSLEEDGNEESRQAVAVEYEDRLKEPTVERVEGRPVTVINGEYSAITNGPVVNENSSKGGTYVYDSNQKIFTAHQPKTPFVKKKIKMSNSSKVAKADTQGEKLSEERWSKEETSTSVAPACTASVQRESEEVMEVESSSSISDLDYRNVAENQPKSATEEASLYEKNSREESICAAPSQKDQIKDQIRTSATCDALTSTIDTSSGTEGKQTAKQENEGEHKRTDEKLGMQRPSPHMTSTQLQQSAGPAPPKQGVVEMEDISKTQDVTVKDVLEKSNTSTDGTSRDPESVDVLCESRTASPRRPSEQTEDQLPGKETTPCQENVCVPRSEPLNGVTPAHKKMNRNNAPLNLERPPDRGSFDARPPQKTASEEETRTDDTPTPSVHPGLQKAVLKMTQDTWDHSRGSTESYTVLFTDPQKTTRESGGDGENPSRCNVSQTDQQSQVDTAIKSVEGTEIQVDEKVKRSDVDGFVAQADGVASKEKVVEMAAEEIAKSQKSRDAVDKDVDTDIVDAPNKEREKSETVLKLKEETSSKFESAMPQTVKPPKNIPSVTEQRIESFQEVPKSVSRVISIADLLRAQIKDLETSAANAAPTKLPADFAEHPAAAAGRLQESRNQDSENKMESNKSVLEKKSEKTVDNSAPRDVKETLMEINHQTHKTEHERKETGCTLSPPVQTLQKPLVIPPISVIDAGTSIYTMEPRSSANKCNKCVLDIGNETGTSNQISLKDHSVVSLPGNENVKNNFVPMTSKEELNKRFSRSSNQEAGTSLTVAPVKASSQESIVTVSEDAKNELVQGKDMEFEKTLTPERKLKNEIQWGTTETPPTTPPDHCRVERCDPTSSCLQGAQKSSTKTVLGADTQGISLQEISMVEQFPGTESLIHPNPEASPLLKRINCVPSIPSATPQELASGARRKILTHKAKPEEAASLIDSQTQNKEVSQSNTLSPSPVSLSTSPSFSRRSPLLQPPDERSSPVEKRSPLLSRRKTTSEVQAPSLQPTEDIQSQKTAGKSPEKDKQDRCKAPQVIRKIRAESFADASGHLKLWCQFFNILSDSTIRWYRNQVEIAQIKRNAADESQVNLGIVQASNKDSGGYRCTISNEYGTDSTDFQLSADVLSRISLREDIGVGEEIEMTPLVFNKGVADSGMWGNKFFGRIMMQQSRIGDGCAHKVWRSKVIYGLEPIFESGNTCVIKARNPIAYGGKEEKGLIDKNMDFVRQECKIQNLAREYCKIFSAEARVVETFGPSLEVIPVYLMYRPANTIPYATVEADLTGVYQKYAALDDTGRLEMRTGSEVEQKCCTLQHWIYQWTNGNLLLTQLEGVDTKITNVGITVKSTGHHGLPVEGNPKVFEQFVSQHQCNYFCGLLGLRSLKVLDSLVTPTKPKSSRSPLLQRKMAAGSSSPQTGRKSAGSPRLPRKAEQEGRKTPTKDKAADALKAVKVE